MSIYKSENKLSEKLPKLKLAVTAKCNIKTIGKSNIVMSMQLTAATDLLE